MSSSLSPNPDTKRPGLLRRARALLSPRRWLTWRLLRRALIGGAVLITAVAAFYRIEYWRGERAWAAVERDARSRGIAVGMEGVNGPPIPEEENAFAAPGLREFFAPTGGETGGIGTFRSQAGRWTLGGAGPKDGRLEPKDGWDADLDAWRAYLETEDLMAAFQAHETALAEIERAVLRPEARFAPGLIWGHTDYPGLFQASKLIGLRARVRFDAGRADLAAQDLLTLLRLGRLLESAPGGWLIDDLVAQGVTQLATEGIHAGIVARAWDAETLAKFDEELGRVDRLKELRTCMEDELRLTLLWLAAASGGEGDFPLGARGRDTWQTTLMPRGWIWQNAATHYRRMTDEVLPAINPAGGTVDLARLEAVERSLAEERVNPYGFVSAMASKNLARIVGDVVERLVRFELCRVECRIERHRLVHGVYPENLDELERPPAADGLHDHRDGQPFVYRRGEDGTWFSLVAGGGADALRVTR